MGAGGKPLDLVCDVSDPAQVQAAAERVERELGPIDVWVNNAMITVMSRISESTPEDYRRVTEVTYLGAVHGTLAALARMRPRDRGVIVQVGSALAYRSIPLQSAYCAAKAAVRGFTDSLRTELVHEGSRVRVTMVQLPALNTPQFEWSKLCFERHPQPVPPIYEPEVAAETIRFAADANRREVWVGGWNVALGLGNRLAPAIGDRYLARTGFDAQFTDEPASADRPHNLYEPLPNLARTRGRFGDRARDRSLQLALSRHRRWVIAAGAAAIAAALIAI